MTTTQQGNGNQAAPTGNTAAQTPAITPPSNPNGHQPKHTGNRYLPALVIVAAVFPIPILAALLTIVFDLSPSKEPGPIKTPGIQQGVVEFLRWLGPSNLVILLGIGITLVIWLLLALTCKYIATPEGGRPSDNVALDQEIRILGVQLEVIKKRDAQPLAGQQQGFQTVVNADQANQADQDHQLARQITIMEIESELERIKETMKVDGLAWALSTGYISLWQRVNRINEAMISILPDERLIEDATYDQLRLLGSAVPNEQQLHDDLDAAIQALRASNKASITGALTDANKAVVAQPTQTGTNQNNGEAGQSKVVSKAEAKALIYKARCTLHKFTTESCDGLVRSRNQLMGTSIIVGFATYLLVIIAIIAIVAQATIEQAMVFYLLGAVVGLFSQLYNEWNSKDVIKDDYGLTAARVLVTPLVSGLAALVGVFLVAMLSITVITPQTSAASSSSIATPVPITTVVSTSTPLTKGTATVTPTQTAVTSQSQPASSATTASSSLPNLANIYNFNQYPQNLLLAAIFGFLPSLVIGLLKKETDKVASDIQSSSAGDHKQANAAGKSAGVSS